MHFLLMTMLVILVLRASVEAGADTPGFGEVGSYPVEQYQIEVFADGLDSPWDISWLQNGDILVSERGGELRLIRDGILLNVTVAGVPDVYTRSQAGLFEVQAHPRFEENDWVYLTYAHGTNGRNTLRLARARYIPTDEGAKLEDLSLLFEADAFRSSAAHYGGRFVFLPDETILLTSGEGYAYRHEAQRLDNHFGKTLRLSDAGKPPADNPFFDVAGALPEIWSFGHRNHQGIVLASEGIVYSNEHGARGGDEINIIKPGANFGWPLVTWGVDYSGAQISPYAETAGTEQPILHWTPSIAPGSLMYYTGDAFPEWKGLLFSAALATRELRVVDPAEPGVTQFSLLKELDVRIRDVAMGPDGNIYVLTEGAGGGQVLKITPNA